MHLSKEVIELRVFKSTALKSLPLTDEDTAGTTSFVQLHEIFKSTRDSGHFELTDGRSASVYGNGPLVSMSCKDEATNTSIYEESRGHPQSENREIKRTGAESILNDIHGRKLEELNRQHANEYQELKEKYNDRIENLLQKLSESNTRFLSPFCHSGTINYVP